MVAFRIVGSQFCIDLLICETSPLGRAGRPLENGREWIGTFMQARHLAYQSADPRSLIGVGECFGGRLVHKYFDTDSSVHHDLDSRLTSVRGGQIASPVDTSQPQAGLRGLNAIATHFGAKPGAP
jgi:hypothetical protein